MMGECIALTSKKMGVRISLFVQRLIIAWVSAESQAVSPSWFHQQSRVNAVGRQTADDGRHNAYCRPSSAVAIKLWSSDGEIDNLGYLPSGGRVGGAECAIWVAADYPLVVGRLD